MKKNIEMVKNKIEEMNTPEQATKTLEEVEEIVFNNPLIMDKAVKEEVMSYHVIERLSEQDFQQLLRNMLTISEKDLTKQQKDDMMKIEKPLLKLIIIERWINRVEI